MNTVKEAGITDALRRLGIVTPEIEAALRKRLEGALNKLEVGGLDDPIREKAWLETNARQRAPFTGVEFPQLASPFTR